MSSKHRILVACSVLLVLGATRTEAQVSGVVSRDRIAQLRTSPDVVIERVGPTGVDTVTGNRDFTLRSDELLVVRRPTADRPLVAHDELQALDEHFDLSTPIIALTSSGVRTLLVTVHTGDGLVFAPPENAFTGDVYIGLEDADQPHERFDLASPILLQELQ
jgi:hypothetical protein